MAHHGDHSLPVALDPGYRESELSHSLLPWPKPLEGTLLTFPCAPQLIYLSFPIPTKHQFSSPSSLGKPL